MKKSVAVAVVGITMSVVSSAFASETDEKPTVERIFASAAEIVRQTARENAATENGERNEPNHQGNLIPREKSRFALNLWGFSYHPRSGQRDWYECERKKEGKKTGLNECNWGTGLRYYHKNDLLGGKHFSEINDFKNSTRGRAITVGTGIFYEILRVGEFTLSPAISLELAWYEHPKKKPNGGYKMADKYIPGIIPGILIAHTSGVTINLVAVPELNKNNEPNGKVEVFGIYLSVKFDAFQKLKR
ncbi:MAG: hypothetical protein HY432_02425 [Candidatus Liptonbacteria bacterium]|nr:hypothetical protein [Candidatus Liptonbacteria bacterium]